MDSKYDTITKKEDMNYKEFHQLDENIVAILNPLLGAPRDAPFSAAEMLNALQKAKLDKEPQTIKKAIKMLEVLIDYVTVLSHGKSKITINSIEKIKKSMIDALKEIEDETT